VGFLTDFVNDNRFGPDDLPAFKDRLFFEGARRRVHLEQFAILLLLSTAISTYGVIGDSVATVIGAMIIAPLMRPIMATTAGLVMGDMRRVGRSLAVVAISVAGVIGVAWLLAEISVAKAVYFETNSQIVGRVSPRLIDLFAALWSGAAGAFAMSREDVADSLPGAAIAIALVPPLCVVGIGLAEREWSAAGGAMLLFATNFLSIVLAGSAVLALLGLNRAATRRMEPRARRNAYLFVALVIILVVIPLGTTSIRVYRDWLIEKETIKLAQQWMAGTEYDIRHVDVGKDQVVLTIYGWGERPELSVLGERLNALHDRPIGLRLVVVPSEEEEYVPVE
jgi:uncharacterized hydrophobic protein (TIGR00271 family)